MKSKLLSRILAILILSGLGYYFFQAKKSNETNVAYLQSVVGEVNKIHELTSNAQKLAAGDKLLSNEIIQTGPSSSALIVFGNGYQFKLRMGENSSIKVFELMKSGIDQREVTVFSLIKGQLIALLNNKNNRAEIKIRTRHMAMGIRGTLFSVMSDGINKTFLGVKHGEVSSINLINNQESIVASDNVMFTSEDGKQSLVNDKNMLSKINWEIDADSNFGIDPQIILNAEKANSLESSNNDRLNGLINSSEKHIVEHENELKRNLTKISELEDLINVRKTAADKDIECLSRYTERCKLLTETELLHRGFPIEYGNKKYINSIISELNKYKQEPMKEINELKLANEELNKTIENKRKIIEEAKAILSNPNSSDTAINEIEKKIKEEI